MGWIGTGDKKWTHGQLGLAVTYIFGIRMASDIIQNGAFAEQKAVAATISIHTRAHTPLHFQKLLGYWPLKSKFNFKQIFSEIV